MRSNTADGKRRQAPPAPPGASPFGIRRVSLEAKEYRDYSGRSLFSRAENASRFRAEKTLSTTSAGAVERDRTRCLTGRLWDDPETPLHPELPDGS